MGVICTEAQFKYKKDFISLACQNVEKVESLGPKKVGSETATERSVTSSSPDPKKQQRALMKKFFRRPHCNT